MNLHEGRLYWPEITDIKEVKTIAYPSKDRQVLVVGSGMSGALSAYRLAKAGYKVLIIDKGGLAQGSTSANTGLIQYMSDKGLAEFSQQIGEEKAVRFYNQSKEAVDTLIDLDDELEEGKTENFLQTASLILATEREKVQTIKEEVAMQEALAYDVAYHNEEDLKALNINAYGGLEARVDINLNPYSFVNRLLYDGVEKYGLEIITGARYLSSSKENSHTQVRLEIAGQEETFNFDKLVIATGYNPPEEFLPKLSLLEIYKTYVLVSQETEDMAREKDFLVWEMKDPYTYFKRVFESRYMIGGFDEKSSNIEKEDIGKHDQDLTDGFNSMLVEERSIDKEYSYTALFGESKDDIPYMGLDPENDDIFIICGLGGNGTVYSTIASTMVLKWLAGESLEEYETFKIGR